MEKTSIYVYRDINDFLNQMEYLNKEYNQIHYYYRLIIDINDMRNQLKYLKRKNLLCATAFAAKNTFKVTIEDKGEKYCITYRFKHRYDFIGFRREMRKLGL